MDKWKGGVAINRKRKAYRQRKFWGADQEFSDKIWDVYETSSELLESGVWETGLYLRVGGIYMYMQFKATILDEITKSMSVNREEKKFKTKFSGSLKVKRSGTQNRKHSQTHCSECYKKSMLLKNNVLGCSTLKETREILPSNTFCELGLDTG